MRKILFPIVVVLLLCPSAAFSEDAVFIDEPSVPVWGEVRTPEELRFTVNNVHIREWVQATQGEKIKMAAITYTLANETKNKKIDLGGQLDFTLTDEFGNVYNRMEKPSDHPEPVEVPNKNFPSFYPGEKFTATVFFEAPVEASQVVSLSIDAQSIGVAEKISFNLPVVRAYPVPPVEKLVLSDEDMQISVPEKLHRVKPGETIPIKVMVSQKVGHPDKIYVITPFHLFEDEEALGRYDLSVPDEQKDGPVTVIVMASWVRDSQEQTLSRSFNFTVKRPKRRCDNDAPSKCTETPGLVQKTLNKDYK